MSCWTACLNFAHSSPWSMVIVILHIHISIWIFISSPFTIPYQFPSTSLYPYLLHIPLPIFTTSPLPPNSIRTCEMRPVVCPKMWLNSFSCRTSMNVSNPNRFGLNQKIFMHPKAPFLIRIRSYEFCCDSQLLAPYCCMNVSYIAPSPARRARVSSGSCNHTLVGWI